MVTILKNGYYLQNDLTDCHEIWQIGPPNRTGSQNFKILKIQDCHHLEKSKHGHIFKTVPPIGMKFGIITHTGPTNWTSI